ncbi:MAG: ABC transporter permease, partial [Jaaginema sp. PMC 1079.18]|nr:ABC transporter permease [Jaaginema sp. PMC 1079.18]
MTLTKPSNSSFLRSFARPTVSHYLMIAGLIITASFIFIALTAPLWQAWGGLQDPTEFLSNPVQVPPNKEHWFGTTRQGYDVFSRTLFGTQAALKVVAIATTLSLVIGVPLGLISGYWGGKVDKFLLFLMDTVYT